MKNDCKSIHETALKELIGIWDAIVSAKDDVSNGGISKFINKKRSNNFSSIARATSNLTLVFPTLCSRAISIETASMVNKALERNCVSMMQKLFASRQLADAGVNNVQDFINQFHSNINTRNVTLDDFFDISTAIDPVSESATNEILFQKLFEAAYKDDMKNLDYYLPSNINETSLNKFIVSEADVVSAMKPDETYGDFINRRSSELQREKNDARQAEADAKRARKDLEDERKKIEKSKENINKDIIDAGKARVDFLNKQTPDSDFKKANELVPSSLIVNFKIKQPDGNPIMIDNAVVGIKSKLYPLDSNDILQHVGEKLETKQNWLVNFFRATTRETSFWKDLVFAIDKAKIDALSMSTRNSSSDKMWKVLERRAVNRKFKKITNGNNDAAAITTLVISQDEVEWLRKNKNIDIERISSIIGLFETLNFICVVIVDESLEVAKFIYDHDDPMWETISFNHLEREASDGVYKKVVNLITKQR